ncbi:MAG TPA: spore germination protein GerW family protein [Clostridia bacterium]|nr:spore germination protein GerW family protein [Clostridia bacterium]
MSVRELIDRIGGQVADKVTVRSVFGEPYQLGEKTIIPVARIGFGFGAGASRKNGGAEDVPCGGGGGGGTIPLGVLEVTKERTRFIHFTSLRNLAAVAMAGIIFGWWMGRRDS